MYNGNGPTPKYRRTSGIPKLYLYIGIALLVLLGVWMLSSFFAAGVQGYFALATGVLLVIGNLRDLLAGGYTQRSPVALLNTLLGAGLIFFFLGSGAFPPFGALWFLPAVLALLIAAPLMFGRASVYATYLTTARQMADGARTLVGTLMMRSRR